MPWSATTRRISTSTSWSGPASLGLGRALVERQLTALRARGVPGLYLDVGADNTNAIAFYEHLGFAAVHRLDTSILMARRLT